MSSLQECPNALGRNLKFSTFIISFQADLKFSKLPGIFQASWKKKFYPIFLSIGIFQAPKFLSILENIFSGILQNAQIFWAASKKTPKLPQVPQTFLCSLETPSMWMVQGWVKLTHGFIYSIYFSHFNPQINQARVEWNTNIPTR